MPIDPLGLPVRLTKPPGGTARAALPAEPASDINIIAAYLDEVVAPMVNSLSNNSSTPGASDIIEVSG